jgi:formylglycine-generating enzyme
MRGRYAIVAIGACLVLVRTVGCGDAPAASARGDAARDATTPSADSSSRVDAMVSALDVEREVVPAAYTSLGCSHVVVSADCKDGWCTVPAGCYVAGAPDTQFEKGAYSEPEVKINLTRAFRIQQTEVTQSEWTRAGFRDPSGKQVNPDATSCVADNCPVNNVNWYDAIAFANALSEREQLAKCYELVSCTGQPGVDFNCRDFTILNPKSYDCRGYRLPMVAEWEYAARAGTYYSGPMVDKPSTDCYDEPGLNGIAWYCFNSKIDPPKRKGTTMPVAQKKANGWGLFDMLGNSAEWCLDHERGAGYGEKEVTDPGDPVKHTGDHMIRGGFVLSNPSRVRPSAFYAVPAEVKTNGFGFRLVKTIFP